MTHEQLFLEATLEATNETAKTGREWEVTIIGAKKPGDVLTVDGRQYVKSKNGRLYDTKALAESADLWDGVKVYDNHLTQAEFEAKQGMRSPANEWLGTIVKPRWDEAKKQLRGVFKVVEDSLAAKLKNAHEQGVLSAIGLSIDTFPIIGDSLTIEGQQMPVIEGFKKILSVDLVGDPAAGGGFERLIAANINLGDAKMDKLTPELKMAIQEMIQKAIADANMEEGKAKEAITPETIKGIVMDTIAEALAADDEIDESAAEADTAEAGAAEAEAQESAEVQAIVDEAIQEARLARAELRLERALEAAKLPEKMAGIVRASFAGRVFADEELEAMVKSMKEAQADLDPTGRVTENGGQRGNIKMGLNEDDKFGLEFARIVMGERRFAETFKSGDDDEFIEPRLKESYFYQAWVKDGKPDVRSYDRMSELIREYLGGNPVLDPRAMEAATTSSLATVVKNTVNIMTAADYSVRERWFEPIVTEEEVNTIDDATLARFYGVSTLPVVAEGAAYTELDLSDEEETAAFVKNGGYVSVTLETMMRDKVNYIRSIPTRMSNAWYNTLSALVSGVFTVNTAAGPVLSDSGALFNATAVSTGGGHANLLTTALSYSAFSAARLAMRKQTDQPLGAGRKLLIEPKFLLVPTDLETTGLQIRNSELVPTQYGGATNAGEFQTANQFYQKFEVLVVPDWTDTDNWALAADPRQFPAIYLIFPRGLRTPQLFAADNEVNGAMFTNDTMRWKIRQMTYRFSSTYNCAPVADWRPLHKSNV